MPLYLLPILATPKWVLREIWDLQRTFLWGGSKVRRKWALVNWQEVCKPKHTGGLGLRDPHLSNKVMGAKIWWQWVSNTNSPWAQMWASKYACN